MNFDPSQPPPPPAPPHFAAPHDPQYLDLRRHSRLGIASFVIAIVLTVAYAIEFVVAGILEASTPGGMDEESPEAILIGLSIFGAGLVNLVGVALGIAGLCTANHKRLFAILGLAFNVALLLGVCGLIAIGMAMA